MLPMPHEVLRAVAEALGANEPVARAPASALEWALDPQAAAAKDVSKFASTVRRVLKNEEEHFRATHEAAWAALRGPRKTLLSPEQRRMSAGQFLDEVWMDPPHAYSYIEVAWSHLGLAGPVPVERLYNHPCWRLYLEVWGIGAYRQAFPANRDKPVGWVDVMQLIYLGCAPAGCSSSMRVPSGPPQTTYCSGGTLIRSPRARNRCGHRLCGGRSNQEFLLPVAFVAAAGALSQFCRTET